MVSIDSAYFGDEKSSRNVTKVLAGKIQNGNINVPVNETLYPQIETTDEVKLTPEDEKNIRGQASQKCNPADQKCMEAEMSQLRQQRFQEKERENIDGVPVIKGRRLTVNVIDNATNQRKTIVVPDGQKFELKNVKTKDQPAFTFKDFTDITWTAMGIGVGIFVVILIIAIPFKLLKEEGASMFAWGSLGANILTPYLGSFLTGIKYFWQGWTNDKNTPKQ